MLEYNGYVHLSRPPTEYRVTRVPMVVFLLKTVDTYVVLRLTDRLVLL
jgi:hypothetical protein